MSQITLKNLYNPIQFLALRPPLIVWGFIFLCKTHTQHKPEYPKTSARLQFT